MRRAAGSAGIDVSVVVPVYNPGTYIQPCVDGLLAQSLGPDRYEAIFVDDGSTDDTPDLLDRLAAEHSQVRVIHQPNSGWSGRPRNVGVDNARGDYVFFCDHDDELGPQALERMVAMARRTGADILIPKAVSRGRPIPRRVFRHSIDDADLLADELIATLTPHKLFRREFLVAAGLRYLEGKVRLEDHIFVMQAYLQAKRISVLADYPCYHRHRRDDRGNAAAEADWSPREYYGYVGKVIDVIEQFTEPGELRDALLEKPYRGAMLWKLGKSPEIRAPGQHEEMHEAIRELARTRFPDGYHRRLPIYARAQAEAVLADRRDQVTDLGARFRSLKVKARVTSLAWREDRLVAEIVADLVKADGAPVRFLPVEGGWAVDPEVIPPELADTPYSKPDIESGYFDVWLTHLGSDVDWYAEGDVAAHLVHIDGEADGSHRLMWRGSVQVDPATAAGGRPLPPGKWELQVRYSLFGGMAMLRPKLRSEAGEPAPMLMDKPARVVSVKAGVGLVVAPVHKAGGVLADRAHGVEVTGGGRLRVAMDVHVAPGAAALPLRLTVVDDAGHAVARSRGRLCPMPEGVELRASLTSAEPLRPGSYQVAIGSAGKRAVPIAAVTMGRRGRVTSCGAPGADRGTE